MCYTGKSSTLPRKFTIFRATKTVKRLKWWYFFDWTLRYHPWIQTKSNRWCKSVRISWRNCTVKKCYIFFKNSRKLRKKRFFDLSHSKIFLDSRFEKNLPYGIEVVISFVYITQNKVVEYDRVALSFHSSVACSSEIPIWIWHFSATFLSENIRIQMWWANLISFITSQVALSTAAVQFNWQNRHCPLYD